MLHFELSTCDERFGSNDEIGQSRRPLWVSRYRRPPLDRERSPLWPESQPDSNAYPVEHASRSL
jgi:hypothetical protein